ncbi:acetyltransferase, GNAT family protein [Tuber magnatum]|uniref:Acetyltransferase, GNAT family protein n=1 Tax=Tuber magnatum TaxID=42249 RepID=A0A317SDH3_9PEZI|nr:acetyltransferase, GNAT family protein [Tuber magnatum]
MYSYIFETARLGFRQMAQADVPAFHEMLSDREATRYWSTPPHTTLSETHTWITESAATATHDYAILLKPTDEVIGKIGCFGTEIGFLLHPRLWGRGYGTEALERFLQLLWEGEARVATADVDPRNERCLRLLKRFGFRKVGRAEGTYVTWEGICGSVYLELRRPSSK